MSADKTLAIDISHWRTVDWAQIPEEVRLVMIKATEGDYYRDSKLAEHVEGALGAGKIVGLYHFYRTAIHGRKVKPGDQAEFFCEHTRQYWGDVHLRANDWERSHRLADGSWYNPCLGSELEDLYNFHARLDDSDWEAFTLVYTNLATWQEWKMENWRNGWQGPAWIRDGTMIDGLWVAAWGVEAPSRLPRPFSEYWMHQFTASYPMPGVFTTGGRPCGVDANWIPSSEAEIRACLGLDLPEPVSECDPGEMAAAYRRGWQARTDSLLRHLQDTREGAE
ncbi:MAG: GH25 family lysozyme [Chloroflexota bacterium]